MGVEGFLLCGLLAGADYSSTAVALKRPGVVEVGPIARHGLGLGAGVRVGACAAGEVALRNRSKRARVLYRVAGAALAGAVVAHNLRIQGSSQPGSPR